MSENSGHDMTFASLNTHIISVSNARIEGEPISPSNRAKPPTAPEIVKSCHLTTTMQKRILLISRTTINLLQKMIIHHLMLRTRHLRRLCLS